MIPVGLRVVGCLVMACVVCFGTRASSVLAQSTIDDVGLRQYLRELEMSREKAESESQGTVAAPLAVPPTCLPGPLPTNPRVPVYSGNAAWAQDQMRFEVWREPCTDGSGRVATLLKVTPLSGRPFVCGSSLTVIQGGLQYNLVRLLQTSRDSGSFCNNVFVPTSLIIDQFTFGPQFDDLQAFTLIHDGVTAGVSRLEVGAHRAETLPPVVQLSLNQSTFRSGNTLRVGLRAQNPGVSVNADFYFGVFLPDGVTALFVTSLFPLNGVVTRLDADPRTFRPLLANVQLPQGLDTTLMDFLVYPFAGGEPPGTYSVFAAFTPPGAFNDGRVDPGDLLVIDARPFSFSP